MKNTISWGGFVLLIIINTACADFLGERSDSALALPETLADNQAMLDRYLFLGQGSNTAQISADDVYLSDADFNTLPYEAEKRMFTWQPDYVALTTGNDWQQVFSRINIFNTVLHNLEYYQIDGSENIRGQALAFRAWSYLEAAQIWCLAYNPATSITDLGLPLRLDPDMNIPSQRASVEQTYQQILTDLHEAVGLLPDQQLAISRPSRRTALALLARTYLVMGRYAEAASYAAQALAIRNDLLDFNALNLASSNPLPQLHAELILPSSMSYSPLLASAKAKISNTIYNTYNDNDLRKQVFFRMDAAGNIFFRGNYNGGSGRSNCLATDELYLIAAEGQAYAGNTTEAMQWLNTLLNKRWRTGFFVPVTAANAQQALQIVRQERRKEMLFRGLRWSDLKRYNREGAGIVLTKTVNGITITLPPNDPRYAVAIPEDVIQMTGMPQNPR